MDVDLFVDPTCAWSWTTFQWLDEVAPARQLRIRLHPYSLALRTGVDRLDEPLRSIRLAGHRSLRVLAALDHSERCAYFHALAGPFYAAIGAGHRPTMDIAAAVVAAGNPSASTAADDEHWDDAVRAAMAVAHDAIGQRDGQGPTIPIVGFSVDGRRTAFQGPLLDPVPTGRAALRLWDVVETMGRMPGVLEISRPHGKHSLVAARSQPSAVINLAV